MAYVKQTWTNGVSPLSAGRFNHMEDGIANAGGTGGATVYVCASNALRPTGEFQCTGTNDQNVINAAIASLPVRAAGRFGKVLLSEGDFSLSGSVNIGTTDDIVLSGSGGGDYNNTEITLLEMNSAASGALISIPGSAVLTDLYLWRHGAGAGPVVDASGRQVTIERCVIDGGSGTGRRGVTYDAGGSNKTYMMIRNCTFYVPGACVYAHNPYLSLIDDCFLYTRSGSSEWCIEITSSYGTPDNFLLFDESFIRISNCRTDGNDRGSVRISGGHAPALIANNTFWYDNYPAIMATDAGGLTIVNNSIGDGNYDPAAIHLSNCQDSYVAGNLIYSTERDGIRLDACDDIIVTGNQTFANGLLTNDTYSGIILDGDTNNCMVYGNMVRHKGETNKPKYGIRVNSALCDTNMIYGNDLKDGYVTAGFSDAGTGTVTTSANRT